MDALGVTELAAGRELDALVAEKVMGWVEMISDYCKPTGWYADPKGKDTRHNGFYPGVNWEFPNGCVKPFNPSTDIAAAWDVVEKMHPHQLHLWAPGALINDELGIHAKAWTAQFVAWNYPEVDNWYGTEAEADTAPLAICRAALLAVDA